MALKITGTNTAAAPGITGDDTDTGLFYGTDTIGFSTGGAEKVRIDSGGRLQIGLSGKTGGDDQALVVNNPITDNKVLELSTANATGRINFSRTLSNTLNTTSYIEWGEPGAQGTGDLKFGTSAGSNNPTERLRITSDGDLTLTGADNVEMKMKCGTSSGNNILAFLNSGGTTRGNITYDSDNDFLLFNVNQSERFRITSGGDVLVATTTDSLWNDTSGGGFNLKTSGQLVIAKQATSIADPLIWLNDTGQTTNKFILFAQDGNEKASIGLAGNDLRFARDGYNETLRITSDGAVRIGNLQTSQNSTTHTSATKLHIDSTKSIKIARLGAGSITSAGWFTVAKIASAVGNYFKCYASIGGDFTQDMCVMELTGSWSASGGLSNSYAEPVFTAHRTGAHSTDRITRARFVKDSSNITYFQIYIASGHSSYWGKSVLEYQVGAYAQNGADSGSAAMFAAGGTVTDIRTLELVDNALCTNAGTHKIYTGGTERLRITSAGNLEKKGGGSYLAYDSQAHLAKQDNYDTNGGKSYWYDASATNGGVNQAYIDGQTGNIMAKGNFVVGTAGKGIDFSNQTASSTGTVTSTGELLDHYEEGEWTPVIDGLSNTPTYHNRVGKYTRIGNIVKCQGFIQIANTKPTFSNTQSVFTISGLPFTSQGTGYNQVIGNVCWSQIDWVGPSRSTYGHVDDTQLTVGIVSSTKCEFKTMGQAKYYMGQLKNIVFHDDGSWILEWDMTYHVAT